MELLELMKHRRSIRKYEDRQIEKADLEKVIQAGLSAPNAGGGQRQHDRGGILYDNKRR